MYLTWKCSYAIKRSVSTSLLYFQKQFPWSWVFTVVEVLSSKSALVHSVFFSCALSCEEFNFWNTATLVKVTSLPLTSWNQEGMRLRISTENSEGYAFCNLATQSAGQRHSENRHMHFIYWNILNRGTFWFFYTSLQQLVRKLKLGFYFRIKSYLSFEATIVGQTHFIQPRKKIFYVDCTS